MAKNPPKPPPKSKPAPPPAKTAPPPAKTAPPPAKTAPPPAKTVAPTPTTTQTPVTTQVQTTRSAPPPPPPPATEEQRRIDKVNELRQAGKLTQNEAEELRQLVRSMSNNKGNLSEDEERYFTKQLNRALESNIQGNIPPPKTPGGNPPGGNPPGGNPPGGNPPGGGPPPPPPPPPVLDDGKINQKDIDAILRLINELQGDVKKLQEENKTLKNELDLISELAADGRGGDDDDDSVEDDATSGSTDVPTTRSSTGTVDTNIPTTNFGADISYPKDAERIWMPNVDTKVKKEVERITMSLIKSTREFLEAGIDYDGINQVPANSGFQGDLLYTDPLENNQSESNESALASEILLGVTDILTKEFAKSDPNSTNYYYIRFLEFFELNYNASGEPYYDLNININNDIIESLKAIVVKVDEDGIETRVAEGE